MTFSIVARDPRTGALGVATATAGPFVGVLVPHIRSGLGAVATQAMTNPYLAVDVLDTIGTIGADDALERALEQDQRRAQRQVVVVDSRGSAAGWTGPDCEDYGGHLLGSGVAVAGNILTGPPVLDAMMSAYHAGSDSLAERLLAALEAGAAAGGDRRGIGSAALRVVEGEAYASVDLRVDWSESPLSDLRRLLALASRGAYADFAAALPRRFPTRPV